LKSTDPPEADLRRTMQTFRGSLELVRQKVWTLLYITTQSVKFDVE
jgi:hypothetical protein